MRLQRRSSFTTTWRGPPVGTSHAVITVEVGQASESDTAGVTEPAGAVVGASETDTAQPVTAVKSLGIHRPKILPGVGETSVNGGPATQSLTMPSSFAAGDLLVAFVAADEGGSSTLSVSGWTTILTSGAVGVFAKIAVGSDTASATANGTPGLVYWAASIVAIRDHQVTSITDQVGASVATSASGSADPPNAALDGRDLWFAYAFVGGGNVFQPYPPSGYHALSDVTPSGGVSQAVAYRYNSADSEDPGTFNTLGIWRAFTVGISGLITEVDTAQPITVNPIRRLIGQASETDTAQDITGSLVQTVAVGQASETDTVQGVTSHKTKQITHAYPYVAFFEHLEGTWDGGFVESYPADMQVGDLIIMFMSAQGGAPLITDITATDFGSVTVPRLEAVSSTGELYGAVWARVATADHLGTDVTFTVDFGAGPDTDYSMVMLVIRAHNVTYGNEDAALTTTGGGVTFSDGADPNPASVSPGGATGKLYLALTGSEAFSIPDGGLWAGAGFNPGPYHNSSTRDYAISWSRSTSASLDPPALDIGSGVSGDTSFAFTVAVTVETTFLRETDTAQAITKVKAKALGLSSETDSALTATAYQGDLLLLTPADTAAIDLDEEQTFTWDHPGPQQDFAFRRRLLPSGSWEWWNGTGWQDTEIFISSATEAVTVPAGDW